MFENYRVQENLLGECGGNNDAKDFVEKQPVS